MTRNMHGLKMIAIIITLVMLSTFIPAINAKAQMPDSMTISENGLQFIMDREGFDSTCFWDYAQWTIGYGTKCDGSGHPSNPKELQKGPHTITKDAAKVKFESAIKNTYVPGVRRQMSGVSMNQNQFDALVSLCYNAGEGRVKKSPLAKYLRGEMTKDQAYSEYCSYVVSAGGKVLQGLKNRRKLEADLFFSNSNSDDEPIVPDPVEAPIIQTEYKYYAPKSNVIIEWNSVPNALNYWIDIYVGSEHIVSEKLSSETLSYTIPECSNGSYGVYVAAIGEINTACSLLYNFYVQSVKAPQVYTQKSHYPPNAEINIEWNSVVGATSYWIDIWRGNEKIVSKQLGNETSYTLKNSPIGTYAVYVTAMQNTGVMDIATNEPYMFTVGEVAKPIIALDYEYYAPESNVKITWENVEDATSYWIDIWNGNDHFLSEQLDVTKNSYSLSKCTEGNYAVFVTAIEQVGEASSIQTSMKYFCVANVEAPIVYIDSGFFSADDVIIKWSSPKGATSYWIDVWYNDYQIITKQLENVNEYVLEKSKEGEYSVVITAFENTCGAFSSQSSEKINFYINSNLQGDTNKDGKISMSDLVLLQKFLLGTGDSVDTENTDLCKDGVIDVYDLILLRKLLTE